MRTSLALVLLLAACGDDSSAFDGGADAALSDAATADGAVSDSGSSDAGSADDAGSSDDGGASDAGISDSSVPDATADVGSSCGNGSIEEGEACDFGDGNSDTIADRCRTDCTNPTCGDGVIDTAEECDEGDANSDSEANACRLLCVNASCGDGVIDGAEACDDGGDNSDTVPGACRTTCATPSCGDGVNDEDEECDDGDANSDTDPDACRTTCMAAMCGDGVVDVGESCDDGADNSNTTPNACRDSCVPARCGDSVVDAGEECDDGNSTDGDGCSRMCTRQNACFNVLQQDGADARVLHYTVDSEGLVSSTASVTTTATLDLNSGGAPFFHSITTCDEHVYVIADERIMVTTLTGGTLSPLALAANKPAVAIECSTDGSMLYAVETAADSVGIGVFTVGSGGRLSRERTLNVPLSTPTDLVTLLPRPSLDFDVYVGVSGGTEALAVELVGGFPTLASSNTLRELVTGAGESGGATMLTTLTGSGACAVFYTASPTIPGTIPSDTQCIAGTPTSIGGAFSGDGTTFYMPVVAGVQSIRIRGSRLDPAVLAPLDLAPPPLSSLDLATAIDGSHLLMQTGAQLQVFSVSATATRLDNTDAVDLPSVHGLATSSCQF